MKKIFTISIFIFFCLSSYSQAAFSIDNFPNNVNDSSYLITSDILLKINWTGIQKLADTNKFQHTNTTVDSFLVVYEYIEQGGISSFKIYSYKGNILRFSAYIRNGSKWDSRSYFNKNLWLSYVSDVIPNLPYKFKLTISESERILKAYYYLLGVESRDEYGWICEYSTAGRATKRREAVITLINDKRIDLLRMLITYPNIQTQLYSADAMIYLNHQKYVSLTKNDWEQIYALRDSDQLVKTCGNAGSYKIYGVKTSELLSKEAIGKIPKKYALLKKIGYFDYL